MKYWELINRIGIFGKSENPAHTFESLCFSHAYFFQFIYDKSLISCGAWKACKPSGSEFIFEELTFFKPVESLYIVDPHYQMGVHCRFGMKGVIAG